MRARWLVLLVPVVLITGCPTGHGDGPATVTSGGTTYYLGCGPEIPESALGESVPVDGPNAWSRVSGREVNGFDRSEVIALSDPDEGPCDGLWNPAVGGSGPGGGQDIYAELERRFGGPPPPGADAGPPSGLILFVGGGNHDEPGVRDTELYAIDPANGATWNLTRSPAAESSPVPSPDGKLVIFRQRSIEGLAAGKPKERAGIFVMDIATRRTEPLIRCPSEGCVETGFAWSPDGWRIAYVAEDGISIIDPRGGNEIVVCAGAACGEQPGDLAWSPSGEALAWSDTGIALGHDAQTRIAWAERPDTFGINNERSSIWIADLRTGAVRAIPRDCGRGCTDSGHVWSPDGSRIAFVRAHYSDEIPSRLFLTIANVASGTIEESARCGGKCRFPWPKDGHDILNVYEQSIQITSTGPHAHRDVGMCGEPCLEAHAAAWSPGSGHLAVLAYPQSYVGEGPYGVYLMRQDGEERRRLDGGAVQAACCAVAWIAQSADSLGLTQADAVKAPAETSPTPRSGPADGRIAFYADTSGGDDEWTIFAVDADGGNLERLVRGEAYPCCGIGPEWAPDGDEVYYFDNDPHDAWYRVPADGGKKEPLDLTEAGDISADGTRVVYLDDALGGKGGLWVRTLPDGTPSRLPLPPRISPDEPRWSPDGKRLTFSSWTDETRDLWVVDVDGGRLTRLTEFPGSEFDAVWAPDGETIAFTWQSTTETDIYLIAPDGSGLRRMTSSGASNPSFSPDGSVLAYTAGAGGDEGYAEGIFALNLDGGGVYEILVSSEMLVDNEFQHLAWRPPSQ